MYGLFYAPRLFLQCLPSFVNETRAQHSRPPTGRIFTSLSFSIARSRFFFPMMSPNVRLWGYKIYTRLRTRPRRGDRLRKPGLTFTLDSGYNFSESKQDTSVVQPLRTSIGPAALSTCCPGLTEKCTVAARNVKCGPTPLRPEQDKKRANKPEGLTTRSGNSSSSRLQARIVFKSQAAIQSKPHRKPYLCTRGVDRGCRSRNKPLEARQPTVPDPA